MQVSGAGKVPYGYSDHTVAVLLEYVRKAISLQTHKQKTIHFDPLTRVSSQWQGVFNVREDELLPCCVSRCRDQDGQSTNGSVL